ncbi:hypothetical protein ACGFH8_25925 [Micromonospora sp. NPDC049175]|uniref:hypothetical protein n=1 Tax=Micromonospora sp. NPDC049175 TaxID=3364266 RepID=UPI003721A2AC
MVGVVLVGVVVFGVAGFGLAVFGVAAPGVAAPGVVALGLAIFCLAAFEAGCPAPPVALRPRFGGASAARREILDTFRSRGTIQSHDICQC